MVCGDQTPSKCVFSLNGLILPEYNQVSHCFPAHLHSSIHLKHTVDVVMEIKELLKRALNLGLTEGGVQRSDLKVSSPAQFALADETKLQIKMY